MVCSGRLTVWWQRCVDWGEDGGGGDGPRARHGTAPRPASRGARADVGHSAVLFHHGVEVGVLHGLHGGKPLLVIIPGSKSVSDTCEFLSTFICLPE